MSRHLLPTAALLGLVSANANATTIPTNPTYTASTNIPAPVGSTGLGTFNPIGSPTGVGGIGDPTTGVGGPVSFNAPFAGTLTMTVTDGEFALAGSQYQAFVNGVSLGFTPVVPLEGSTHTFGQFTVAIPAGPNNFDINDVLASYVGQDWPPPPSSPTGTVGASFFPTGVAVTLDEELPSAVPEPASLGLIGTWLLGLQLFWRRRQTG